MFTSHNTQSCRQSKAMRPVSEKNLVLAFTLFSSAATKDSWKPSKADIGTFMPCSKPSVAADLLGLFGRAKLTSACILATSASVRNAVWGCTVAGPRPVPLAGVRCFCVKLASRQTRISALNSVSAQFDIYTGQFHSQCIWITTPRTTKK